MKKLFMFLLMTSFVMSFANFALATDRYVGGGGTPNYTTIQDAINASSDGDIIHVAAGTYAESILINKEITLLGANININPNTGSRVAESIIVPATSDPDPNSSTECVIINIHSNNVIINGFTIDGDNPLLTSSWNFNGANIDAAEGIIAYDNGYPVGNLDIKYNIFKNYSYSACDFDNYGGPVTSNNYIRFNKFDNVSGVMYGTPPARTWGIGIVIYDNFYAAITDNVMTRVRVGIQTGNFYSANTGSTQSISNNNIQSEKKGLFYNLHYSNASAFTVSNNNFTTVLGATNNWGISITSQQSAVTAAFLNNNVTGAYIGINFWNDPTTNTLTVTGGTINNCSYGIQIDNYDGYTSNGESTIGNISGVTLQNSTIAGVYVKDNPLNSNNATVLGNILTGTIFTNNPIDVKITGNDASASVNSGVAYVKLYTDHSLKNAINAARSGDIINIATGTYTEDISLTKNLTIQGESPANRPIIAGLASNGSGFTAFNGMLFKNLIFRNTSGLFGLQAGTTISGNGMVFDKVDFDFIGTSIPNVFGYPVPVTFVSLTVSGTTGLQFINSKFSISNTPVLNGLNCNVWLQATGGPILFDGVSISGSYTDGGVIYGAQINLGTAPTNVEIKNSSTLLGGNFYLSGITGLSIHDNTFTNSGMGLNNVENVVINNNIFQNIDQSFKCGGPGSTNRVIQMEAAWGDATYKLKNISITNNIFTNINNVRAAWVTRYTSGDPTPATFSNVQLHNNSFAGVSGIVMASDYPTAIPNATLNWWGTAVESEIIAKLSGTIIYNPWIGSLESKPITNANLNIPVNFGTANTNLTFTSLPPATNATVSVQRIESSTPPAGVPAFPTSAGSGLPLYLMITATGLTNYTFSVEVVVDVSGIPGFTTGSKVMYFSTASHSWVGIAGVYNATAKTFTFTTDHFTPFGFVNPTNPNDIYLSQVASDPVNTQKWYPAVGMGSSGIASPDWNYVNVKATYYVVPTGTTGMFSSKFAVVWDKSKANLTVTPGNYWENQVFKSSDSSNGRWIEIANTDYGEPNPAPGGGRYFAKLEFTNIKPGYIPVSIDGADFRYRAGDSVPPQSVYATTHPGKILFYLGDIAKSGDETIGDGKITGADLSLFSAAYWSVNGTHPSYKFKYDIGPTNANGSYWALPTPDGRIEFEDLNIFAIGYGKTGSGQLPDNPGENKMNVSTLAMKYENGYLKVPVKVSGAVKDFRTGSFEFGYSSSELEFAGFEKKGGFEGDDNFMISKTENNKIMLDAAIVGTEKDGMNGEQIIMNLLFTEKQSGGHNVNVLTARARNSGNTPIETTFDGSNGANSEIPTTFSLAQNYPNPFNPSTTIKYGLPKDAKVSLVVFDMLGRKVMTLVNDMQKAGYHEVQFNSLNLSSGTYFYKISAGDFTSIKRMILLK